MKIIFFSDVHGNQYSMHAFLRDIKLNKYDQIIFCGDLFGYYYGQKEILNQMKDLKNLTCIMGNHDKNFLDAIQDERKESLFVKKYGHSYFNLQRKFDQSDIDFVKSWPNQYCLTINKKKIAAFHGSPLDVLNGRIYPDTDLKNFAWTPYDYVILGHTHHKMNRVMGKTRILNPGSLGQQRDGRGCSYLVLDTEIDNYRWNIINYDIKQLVSDVDKHDIDKPKFKEVLFRQSKGG